MAFVETWQSFSREQETYWMLMESQRLVMEKGNSKTFRGGKKENKLGMRASETAELNFRMIVEFIKARS